MAGIISYGMYVPYNRMARKELAAAYGTRTIPGEKAVANYDEDSLTMAVAAARNCLAGKGDMALDSVQFASTTAPSRDKQQAALIVSVLDREGAMRTADFGGSLRAGTSALLAALDMARLGQTTLVAAADCRMGAPDSTFEAAFGDGAAAFCIGSENVIAECLGSYSAAHDFYDVWRDENDKFVRFFDERFAINEGFLPFTLESIRGVLAQTGLKPEDFARVVVDASTDKKAAALLKAAGFTPEQGCAGLIHDFGYSGAAYAPMLLASALEQSAVGDLILFVSYGEGSDAVVFKVTAPATPGAGKGAAYFKAHKRSEMNYEKYLKWKQLMDFEPPRRLPLNRSSLPDFYRKRKKNLAGYGTRCTKCGTPHFPPSRICIECAAIDEMEPYCFLNKKAKLATYTIDYLAFSLDSPNVVVVVDFEGGGRMFTNMVDCDLDEVAIDMPVTLVYRKMFTAGGIHTYFWKCVPGAQ